MSKVTQQQEEEMINFALTLMASGGITTPQALREKMAAHFDLPIQWQVGGEFFTASKIAQLVYDTWATGFFRYLAMEAKQLFDAGTPGDIITTKTRSGLMAFLSVDDNQVGDYKSGLFAQVLKIYKTL